MGIYKSFSTTKRKLANLWEQNQDTSHEISKNIKVIDTSFLSVNDLKRPETVILLDNYLEPGDTNDGNRQYIIELINFPDWAIAFSKLSVIYSLWDISNSNTPEYDITKIKDFKEALSNQTLEVGDLELNPSGQIHWWTKYDGGWKLTLAPSLFLKKCTSVSLTTFTESFVNTNIYINAKLYINNEKTYNAIQSGH